MKRAILRHALACALAGTLTLGGVAAATTVLPTPAIAAPSNAIRPVQLKSELSNPYGINKITLEAGKTYILSGDVEIYQYIVKGGTASQPTRIYLSASNPVNDKRDARVEIPMFALESGYIEIIGDTGSTSQATVNCNGRVFLSDKTEESIYSYDYDAPARSGQLDVKVSNLTITGNDNESTNVSGVLLYGSMRDGETVRFENSTFCNWKTPYGPNSFGSDYEYYKNSPAPVTIRMTSKNTTSAPSVAFSACTFRNNRTACAGALSITSNSSLKPNVSLTGCTFNSNRQNSNFCADSIGGLESEHLHSGNIVVNNANLTLSGCIMTSTKTMGFYGPAAYMTYSSFLGKYHDMPMTSEIAIGSKASCTLSGTTVSDTYASGYYDEKDQDEKRYAIYNRGSLTLSGSTSVSTAKAGQVKLTNLLYNSGISLDRTFSGRASVTVEDSEFSNLGSSKAIGDCGLTSEQLAQQITSTNAGVAFQTQDGKLYVNRLKHEHVWQLTADSSTKYQMNVNCVGTTRPEDCGYSGYTAYLNLASGTEKSGRVNVTYGTTLTPRLTTSGTGTGTLSPSIATITETRYFSLNSWNDIEPQAIATPTDTGKHLMECVITSATGDTVTLARQFEITPLDLQKVSSLTIEYEGGRDTTIDWTSVRAFDWTGEEITPKFTISGYNNGWFDLVKGTDYTVVTSKYSTPSATNPPDSSSYFPYYIIYIKGTGNYTGTVTTCWTIVGGQPFGEVTAEGFSGTYDGNPHTVSVSVADAPEDVTIEYSEDGGTTWSSDAPSYTNATRDSDGNLAAKTVTYRITANGYATKTGTVKVEITRASQDSPRGWSESNPDGIRSSAESSHGLNDGSLSNLSSAYEWVSASDYNPDGTTSWNAVDDDTTSLEGLEPGIYYVRYKEDENHEASQALGFKVDEGEKRADGTGWHSDEIGHWHLCTCGSEKLDEAEHDLEWVVTVPPTATTEGSKSHTCKTCGYVTETATIPMASVTGYSDEYDGQEHPVNTSALPEGATASFSVNGGDWTNTVPTIKNVGSKTVDYKVELDGSVIEGQVTLEVRPRAITVWATSNAKTYGDTDPELRWEIFSGEMAGDERLSGITVSREQGESVREGGYAITATQDEGANPNYDVTFKPGMFIISPRTLTVTWGTTEFVYDGNEHCPEATLGNVIGDDDLSATVEGTETDAGDSNEAAITGLIGADAGNYALPADGLTCSFSIKNAEQGAPVVQATAETIYGKCDGSVTGVTGGMEWKRSDDTAWTYVTEDGDLENLPAGSYDVRYAAKANHDASPVTTVTVKPGRMLVVSLPENQDGYTLTATDAEMPWHGDTTLRISIKSGYFASRDSYRVKVNGKEVVPSFDGTIEINDAEGDVIVTVEGILKHEPDGTGWHFNESHHWRVCNCGNEMDWDVHKLEWKTVTEATASSKGSRQQVCKVCGATGETEDTPMLAPSIIEGAGQKLTVGSVSDLTVRSNAPFDLFKQVKVNGTELDASSYTVAGGSTVVTLKASFLATLSTGEHALDVVSETGTATTTFTIAEKKPETGGTGSGSTGTTDSKPAEPANKPKADKPVLPATGDTNSAALAAGIATAGVTLIAAAALVRRH